MPQGLANFDEAATVGSALPDGQSGAVVTVSGLAKRFGETVALADCSVSIRAGEVHAIVGENGSGKSTLAKILSGVMRPDQGKVSIFGQSPATPREARQLGVATIFQEILVADEATVIDNLFAGSERKIANARSSEAVRRGAVAELQRLSASKVEGHQKAGTLSLAVKQWIVILRAILTNPKVLILDESSAALDLEATHRLHAEMHKLKAAGCTIIIVTHRIAELVRIADVATVLRDGRTAGVIPRGAISEQSLIAMMSPEARSKAALSGRPNAPAGRKDAPAVLQGGGLRIDKSGASFSFALGEGQIVGVTGLEGQGQDSFVRALAGIENLREGELSIKLPDGRSSLIRSIMDAELAGIAYVSGDRKREGIFPNLSIFENLTFGLYRREMRPGGTIDRSSFRATFDQEVARLKIRIGNSRNAITSLSGGNQQKVLLSRALAKKPRILILNDPARGVDIGTKRDIYRELKSYAAGGGAVVYLSSEIEEFPDFFADRVEVFFNRTRFRTVESGQLSEHALLASIFGNPIADSVDFDD